MLNVMHVACVIRVSLEQRSASAHPELASGACCNRPRCEVQGTEALGMTVFSFEAFAQLGSERPSPANPPQPEDLCTIMYTSGTTDKPKVSYHTCFFTVRMGSPSVRAATRESAARVGCNRNSIPIHLVTLIGHCLMCHSTHAQL